MSFVRLLFLIRHGETGKNDDRIIEDGTYPGSPLNRIGEIQAAKTSRALALDYSFQGKLIVTSDLVRAVQTSEILKTHLGGQKIKIIKKPELREFLYGDLNREKHEDILKIFPDIEKQWVYDPKDNFVFPGSCKTIGAQRKTMIKCVKSILQKTWLPDKSKDNKDIIFVAHGITLRAIVLYFIRAPFKCWSFIDQENCCINIIKFCYRSFYSNAPIEKPEITLSTLNNTKHIKDGQYRTY